LQTAPSKAAPAKTAQKPFGLDKRVPWTTSKIVGTPDPPNPYALTPAFPKLKFTEPLELIAVPGANRLAIAERHGKLFTFEDRQDVAQADLLGDLQRTVYGLAFHPKYAENGYVYTVSLIEPAPSPERGTRVSRFETTTDQPRRLKLETEKTILEWPAGGHNGGCLRFGPEGYLYIVTGDGSGIADELQTGQDLTDLLGSILRIDVDRVSVGRNYLTPNDNPFVNLPGARPEVWAYGLRQAWKIGFDPKTRDLWAGEVGQDLWEMVLRIQKGGNYGWSVKEGREPFRPERKLGPTPILPPLVVHPHSEFRSITGGYVYHGKRLPELENTYIYGDYDTGKVWGLRVENEKLTFHRELTDTTLRIVAFGEAHNGELYAVDFIGGGLFQLTQLPQTEAASSFPRKLSETGLFQDVANHAPAPGVLPYDVLAALWSDGADKVRYLAVPGLERIEFDTVTYPQPSPGSSPGWRFPNGTVLVKTFALEMETGNPASQKRLETRILHVERTPGTEEVGDQVWRGYTYLWNDEQTDATLLEGRDGLDRNYTIRDARAPGGTRTQTWHFPSRTECTLCHTVTAKYALGVNTLQMNRDFNYHGVIDNQLRTFEHIGMFTGPLPKSPEQLPKLVDYHDPQQPLDQRARAYLHANCAHCHMKWGGGNADFKLLYPLPLAETGIVNVSPGHGSFNVNQAKLLVPGQPERSLIFHRMDLLGLGRMPHIASRERDTAALQLLRAWIMQLPAQP